LFPVWLIRESFTSLNESFCFFFQKEDFLPYFN